MTQRRIARSGTVVAAIASWADVRGRTRVHGTWTVRFVMSRSPSFDAGADDGPLERSWVDGERTF